MSVQLETLRAQGRYGWSRAFATAYAVERVVNRLGHRGAFRQAQQNPMVRAGEKPVACPEEVR